jgi:hypothetical protein
MPLPIFSSNDFLHGVDFTGVNPINAGDLNNLVDLSEPYSDGATRGKGIILWTIDTALDTPDVPSPVVIPKWIRYVWIRIPYVGAEDKVPKIYGWNNDSDSAAILLKWNQLIPDVAQFQAQIDIISAQLNALEATTNGAIASANAASVTANAAFNLATTAQTDADTAQATAVTAQANSANAVSTATNALTIANAAKTAADTNKTIFQIVPGTAGQKIRTNLAASALEYFNDINNYVRVSETQAIGVDAGASINGTSVRALNTEDFDGGNNVTIAASKITLKAGIWKVYGTVPSNAGAGSKSQAYLIDDVAGTKIIKGTSEVATAGGSTKSILVGIVTLAADTVLRIDHHCDTALAGGLGKAAGFDTEVYTILELWRIN